MAIVVTTKPTANDIDKIVRVLDEITELTPRTKKALKSSQIAVARDGDELIGWLISEHLCKNVYEIGGAYINPNYRRQGIFEELTKELINSDCVYLVASYHSYIIRHFLRDRGFRKSSLMEFAKLSNGRFITKRIRTAVRVAHHLSNNSAKYIIRMDNT